MPISVNAFYPFFSLKMSGIMSGCNHPINFGGQNRINVTPLEFNSVLGSEKARLLVNEIRCFNQGDPVELIEVTVNERIPTGRSLSRFVLYVEGRVPLYSDDDYIVLHLVPARYMIDVLNKS